MLLGADRFTGKPIKGVERAVQNIETSFTTPKGSQPGERNYGTTLIELISQPANDEILLDITDRLNQAIDYEPEAELLDCGISEVNSNGETVIWYRIKYEPDGNIYRAFIGSKSIIKETD
jgi:phage baseplate assembly protein W